MQATIKSKVLFNGCGLHKGINSDLAILPAPPDHGIKFRRTDAARGKDIIPAHHNFVKETFLRTEIENEFGVSVSTVEHVVAGLAACGIQNALIELNGPEVPILDGSALRFAERILEAGRQKQSAKLSVIRILERVEVSLNGATAALEPAQSAEMTFTIKFPDPIGTQSKSMNLSNGAIVRHLIDSRTFCLESHLQKVLGSGFGLGGNEKNVLLVNVDRVLYVKKLRHIDECVRHKMLDAIGDLSLAGRPIIGRFVGVCSGHKVTHELLKRLFARPEAYEIVEADETMVSQLPGTGVNYSDIPVYH